MRKLLKLTKLDRIQRLCDSKRWTEAIRILERVSDQYHGLGAAVEEAESYIVDSIEAWEPRFPQSAPALRLKAWAASDHIDEE